MTAAAGGRAEIPLARLFLMAYRALIDALHERLRARGWTDVRPAFGFVLLAARGGTTAAAVAGLMGTSKQAAAKLITSMADAGYVQREPSPTSGREKLIVLAPAGQRLLAVVEEIYAELEAEWAAAVGAAPIAALRRSLLDVLAATYGQDLPSLRPTW